MYNVTNTRIQTELVEAWRDSWLVCDVIYREYVCESIGRVDVQLASERERRRPTAQVVVIVFQIECILCVFYTIDCVTVVVNRMLSRNCNLNRSAYGLSGAQRNRTTVPARIPVNVANVGNVQTRTVRPIGIFVWLAVFECTTRTSNTKVTCGIGRELIRREMLFVAVKMLWSDVMMCKYFPNYWRVCWLEQLSCVLVGEIGNWYFFYSFRLISRFIWIPGMISNVVSVRLEAVWVCVWFPPLVARMYLVLTHIPADVKL